MLSFMLTIISSPTYLESGLLVGIIRGIDDFPAVHFNDPVGGFRNIGVVCHHDHRKALFCLQLDNVVQYQSARVFIQCACRLVEEKYLRIFGKRSCNGDALLLAAAELRGE